MEHYPLAVYTAEHGLAWHYDRATIPFAALDACRKAFGALPDFDAGEVGFEGVWATPERVFAMCCQSAPAWDFRGRNATYLAVTWVPREQAARTDFEALLASPALRVPTHTPPNAFAANAACPPRLPLPAPTVLADGFAQVGAAIAGLPPGASAIFRRGLGERAVCVRVHLPTRPASAETHPTPSAPLPTPLPSSTPSGLLLPWPATIAAVFLWLLTLAVAGGLAYRVWHLQRALSEPPTLDLWPCHCDVCDPTFH